MAAYSTMQTTRSILFTLLATAPAAFAQSSLPPLDATALVRRAVQHRLDATKNHRPLQYLLRRVDEHRDSTKAIVETQDGDVARLVAINNKPLGTDTDKAELDRLNTLAQHPELQEKRRRSEQKDADRVTHLLGLLPDAFLYKLEGTISCGAGRCYRLSFTPNPRFTPPDLESGIFRGIAGEVWVDQAQERLTRLDAHFITEADVGFGILGRLNKGGTILLEQTNLGDNDWELHRLKIHVTGKILMVRSFSYQVDEEGGRFTPVALNLRYRDAIDLLKKLDPQTSTYTP